MSKRKEQPPQKELAAPFYMISFGDMVSLLLTFFILLYTMSTMQSIKFQAQVGILKGSLGISDFYSHAPMQQNMPGPAVKQSTQAVSLSEVKPTSLQSLAEYDREDLTEPVQHGDNDEVKLIQAFGSQGNIQVSAAEDEVVLILPTFDIFKKGSSEIDVNSPEVKRVRPLYASLAKQVSSLTGYDIWFIGHTDALPLTPRPGGDVQNNMELGFQRAIVLYDVFFQEFLRDRTRITFASQGDNVPIIPNATLDSELRKNRRVEIHLKKKK